MKHYKEKLVAYFNQELSNDENQEIANHLRNCSYCQKEYEEIRFGAKLVSHLERRESPITVWQNIEKSLNSQKKSFQFSDLFRKSILVPALTLILITTALSFAYLKFWRNNSTEVINQTVQKSLKRENQWNVETILGNPTTNNQTITNKGFLTVGETLETDQNSKATVQVADIGQVEIQPNSRVQLVKTESTEHRLSLEKGALQARILAPPRLFIVDTPSAVAVDLGCAYTLEVDNNGDSKLHVTSGFVALEKDGRESIVPAGAIAITKKGKGLGTPFAEDASAEYSDALYKFDFENGGEKSLQTILKNPNIKTSLTLWHLLSRVPENDRERVFNKLVSVVELPEGVTKQGVLRLDTEMLKVWRLVIEGKWFEKFYE